MKLPENVGFKKSPNIEYVTMFSIQKLERIIPTIIIMLLEIERGDPSLGLARLGSHLTEQQIGQIRLWCNYDHRANKILHSTACHHFLKANANSVFPNLTKRNRLNSGGCNLTEGEYQHNFIFSIEDMARIILSTVSWAECTAIEFNSLIQNFNEFVHNAPFTEITLPTQTACRIEL